MVSAASIPIALRSLKLVSRLSCMQTPALISRQITMDSKSVASQLKTSGLLRTQGLIGGKWVDSYDGETIKVYNPSTGEVIADVPCMGRRETNDAISSAFDAYKSWSKLTASERSKYLRK
ncbi:Succinylglutamate-semialdehyde dehydrogenase, partial [Trema orientale]